jgi:hypothetical protein
MRLDSGHNPMTEAKVKLGRMLYYEPRLSLDNTVSCNSCHDLEKYGVDGMATSKGYKGQFGGRNSPTVYHAAGHLAQFWDGRADDVEQQAKGPVLNPVEMAMPAEPVVVKVLESMPEVRFVVAGSGTHEEELRSQAETLGLLDHGTFVGWIGDDVLHSLYRIADLCVVPSIYEPFGLVALEAMASSCPCIVADTGGLWFFNSSATAGASQPHRHLQLLPRAASQPSCPLAASLLAQLEGHRASWPWRYALSRRSDPTGGSDLPQLYADHCQQLGIGSASVDPTPRHAHNLLFNDDWFLTVLRLREHCAGFSVNGLGFAGYLLCTAGSDLDWLARQGPWQLLASVAAAAEPGGLTPLLR